VGENNGKVFIETRGMGREKDGRGEVMKRGLTLIEVCVTIAILSAILLSMLGIFQQGYRYLNTARDRAAAINIAVGQLEECWNWDVLKTFDSTPGVWPHSGPVNRTDPANPYTLPSVTLNNVTYTCGLNIDSHPYSGNYLKLITVTVSWTRGGRSFKVSLSTLKANII
jgi:prepilin-type N-terminal cleavage/methylation domain-containing protein